MIHRDISCCFTGHRPEKLPWGVNEKDPRCLQAKVRLLQEIERACNRGYQHFISGMARGTDLYFCEAVLTLRETYPNLTLEAAIPYPEQASRWPTVDQKRYQRILDRCNFETLVQHQYAKGCLHRRNRYMVDRSSLLLSIYDGQGGGTMQTLAYAMEQGIEVTIIDI